MDLVQQSIVNETSTERGRTGNLPRSASAKPHRDALRRGVRRPGRALTRE